MYLLFSVRLVKLNYFLVSFFRERLSQQALVLLVVVEAFYLTIDLRV